MKKVFFLLWIPLLMVGCAADPEVGDLPAVVTGTASNVTFSSAEVSVMYYHSAAASEAGILWDIEQNVSKQSNHVVCSGYEGLNTKTLDGLPDGQQIFYRAYAKDDNNVYILGEVKSFTTLKYLFSTVTTGDWAYVGYNSNQDYPYEYYYEASLIGVSNVSSWGVMLSMDVNFSSPSQYEFNLTNYVPGTASRMHLSWRFGSGSRTTTYFKAYAVLKTGGTIYGLTKSVY